MNKNLIISKNLQKKYKYKKKPIKYAQNEKCFLDEINDN